MENEDIIALLALGVSILGSIVNGLYTLDTRKKQEALEKEKIRADENNRKEQSLITLKTEIYDYRKTLLNILHNQNVIHINQKDYYSFNTVLRIQNLKNCLGNEYKKYLDLESEIDTVLNEIIYKKEFSRINDVTHKIKYFLDNINEIKFD
jgi:hypothetical protein